MAHEVNDPSTATQPVHYGLSQDVLENGGILPEEDKPWGVLVALAKNNIETKAIPLRAATITFGRHKDSTVRFEEPFISGTHCTIIRESDGRILLEDNSTNGTYLHAHKVGLGKRELLKNEDVIYLAPRMITPDKQKWPVIGYVVYIHNYAAPPASEIDRWYQLKEVLGSGAFATVKMAIHKSTAIRYACKVLEKKRFRELNPVERKKTGWIDEVKILKNLKHPHIIHVQDFFDSPEHFYIVMELMQGGDLFDQIYNLNGKAFSEARARNVVYQIALGIQFLHENGIVHRDIKPENIMLAKPHVNGSDYDEIRIADFGLSRMKQAAESLMTICGTPQYLAPEVGDPHGQGYDERADVWSLGVLAYVLLTGRLPWTSDSPNEISAQSRKGKIDYRLLSKCSAECHECIKAMLTVKPADRLSVKALLEHPWLSKAVEEYGIHNKKRKSQEEEKVPTKAANNASEGPASMSIDPTLSQAAPANPPSNKKAKGNPKTEQLSAIQEADEASMEVEHMNATPSLSDMRFVKIDSTAPAANNARQSRNRK